MRGSLLIRTIEIVHRALLAARSPPRLRRCRVVFPDDASNGLTPHNAANAASLRSRSGLSPDERQNNRYGHAGRDWKVENAVRCFDANVSWEAPKPWIGEPWPEQSDQQKNHPDRNKSALHATGTHLALCIRAANKRLASLL